MPPPQQGAPVMELEAGTERAISGHMDAHGKPPFLNPAICLICTDHTFGDAVMVTSSCGHHFHPKCIEDAMRQNGAKCPCGAAFPPGKEPVVEATRMHKQMMNGIEVQCPQACEGVMPFELIRAHIHNADGCPNTPYRCGNEGCGVVFQRKDKDEHLRTCLHRLTPCALCQQPVKHGELQQHMADLCPRRKVRCPHCKGEHDFIEEEQHRRRCTGAVTMMHLAELREMMAQQQAATAQLRDQAAQQQRTITELRQTIEQHQRTNAQLQQTNERQQREIAELREVQEEQRRREERERAALPQCLTVSGTGPSLFYNGEYSLRPERSNGAAVWGKGRCRLYRTLEGHWGLTTSADGPQRNVGRLRLTSQPGSPAPLSTGGWAAGGGPSWDMSRADGWEPQPAMSVAAA